MNFHDQNRSFRRCRFIGLGSASTGHWPINRRCANKLCAYEILPMLVGKIHYRLWARSIDTRSTLRGPLPTPDVAEAPTADRMNLLMGIIYNRRGIVGLTTGLTA